MRWWRSMSVRCCGLLPNCRPSPRSAPLTELIASSQPAISALRFAGTLMPSPVDRIGARGADSGYSKEGCGRSAPPPRMARPPSTHRAGGSNPAATTGASLAESVEEVEEGEEERRGRRGGGDEKEKGGGRPPTM